MTKSLQPAEKIIQSLLNYREELLKASERSGRMSETLLKLNSCLYAEYPHQPRQSGGAS